MNFLRTANSVYIQDVNTGSGESEREIFIIRTEPTSQLLFSPKRPWPVESLSTSDEVKISSKTSAEDVRMMYSLHAYFNGSILFPGLRLFY